MGDGAPTALWPAAATDGPLRLEDAEARLVVLRPNLPEVEIRIEKNDFSIGRATVGVDLTLDDDLVSRRHVCLKMDEKGYFKLEDLGSANGIGYAGRMVRRLNLVDGDEFTLGQTQLRFHAKLRRFAEVPAAKPPRPRQDSVFADVEVPAPSAQPGRDNVGWSPEKIQPPAAEPPAEPEGE